MCKKEQKCVNLVSLTGAAEVGMPGVPGHNQYFGLCYVGDSLLNRKIWMNVLWAHPIFSGFRRPCISRQILYSAIDFATQNFFSS